MNNSSNNTVLKLRILFVVLVCSVGFQCIWILSNTNKVTENNKKNDDAAITTTTKAKTRDDALSRSLGLGGGGGGGGHDDDDDDDVETTAMTTTQPQSQQLSDVTESAALKEMMMTTNQKKSDVVIITNKDRQGFHLPKDLVEWNLPGTKNDNFTKTICVKTGNQLMIPPPPTKQQYFLARDMFQNTGWDFVTPKTKTKAKKNTQKEGQNNNNVSNNNNIAKDCQFSLMRFLYDNVMVDQTQQSSNKIRHLQNHQNGQQLTSSLLGGGIDKGTLATLIQNQNEQQQQQPSSSSKTPPLLLKESIPITRSFDSDESCIQFCNGEWSKSQQQQQQQQWIWKPKISFGGKGIMLIGDDDDNGGGNGDGGVVACRRQCVESGGNNIQAQILTNSMVIPTNDDGRKFYVRSHILVAIVDPLIVFTGAEYIRICAEPIKFIKKDDDQTTIEPYPGLSPNSKFNPFQHICNGAISKKHPTKYSPSHNTGPLSIGIPDDTIRTRILTKLDDHNRALVDLLHSRWSGDVGMFQLFAADYIIDEQEKMWLLEINKQPGFPRSGIDYPNPWGDIFEIEWEILTTYNKYQPTVGNSYADGFSDDWKIVLEHKLSDMESGLETLRRLQL